MLPRIWLNLHFLYDKDRVFYLKEMLQSLNTWNVHYMDISVHMNNIDDKIVDDLCYEIDHLLNDKTTLEIRNYDIDNPMSLAWKHKGLIPNFLKSYYTHFIYTDADLNIPGQVIDYWIETRKFFIDNGYKDFLPGTFRIEDFDGAKRASDITYRTDLNNQQIVKIGDKHYFSPTEPFQDIGILDKEFATEYIDSPYAQEKQVGCYGFGYIETSLSEHIFCNKPDGYPSKILYPLEDYERSWYYHIPANYAKNPDSEHGKIPAASIFETLKGKIND